MSCEVSVPEMSRAGYAEHRGVTIQAVNAAIKTGRITPLEDGRIDSEKSDAEWAERTDPAAARTLEGSRQPRGRGRPPNGKAEASAPEVLSEYLASRSKRETFRARREELALEKDSGKLVPLADVRAAAFNTGRRLREQLLTIPDRVAPVVAGLSDIAECHRVVREEILRALEELVAGEGETSS
jgi:hypothetical protein